MQPPERYLTNRPKRITRMSDLPACNNGTHCPGWNGQHAEPTTDPLCLACLDRAERDIRGLVYDYVDLAQLHAPSLSQAPTDRASGTREAPMPIAGHVDALQAEIVHVTTTWEAELRVAQRLPDPETLAPLADWHTTLSRPTPVAKVRPGAAVQRAIGIIGPRVRALSLLPATAVCPTGIEDDPTDLQGWEAVQHLQRLHGRARHMLGRTRRTFWIPGECWACDARPTPGVDGPLWRSEPRDADDPMQVGCSPCGAQRQYADYEAYQQTLLWPGQPTDGNVRIAA
jgi:hypothetical protein